MWIVPRKETARYELPYSRRQGSDINLNLTDRMTEVEMLEQRQTRYQEATTCTAIKVYPNSFHNEVPTA